ncbi:hypothetical protein [Actinomadura decatromicini]|uniref:Uncharacterized protein n=1 Tax=Actinomadura decatromicini TaxID=2604572 RepID=A0A5D3FXL8_9ACTN|nr:hypothetical protein [Actinomadura decatromicini]TYK52440.1 hypothetical protein FXF68_01255 [Actinomadura decatromicini]
MIGAIVAVIAAFMIAGIVAGVVAAKRERRRRAEFLLFAESHGWTAEIDPAAYPDPVATAGQSPRTQCTLEKRIGAQWIIMNWHRWTETVIEPGRGSDDSDRVREITKDLTRYFALLSTSIPDMTVKRRSRVGGRLRRNQATGDPRFDRTFRIEHRPGTEVASFLTPDLRADMLTKTVPLWEIENGVLILAFEDRPTIDNLDARAIATGRVAARLLGEAPPAAEETDQIVRKRIDWRHPYRDHSPSDFLAGFLGLGALIAAIIYLVSHK